jgi:hypothetical protein
MVWGSHYTVQFTQKYARVVMPQAGFETVIPDMRRAAVIGEYE